MAGGFVTPGTATPARPERGAHLPAVPLSRLRQHGDVETGQHGRVDHDEPAYTHTLASHLYREDSDLTVERAAAGGRGKSKALLAKLMSLVGLLNGG
jgi:hypothetical protein